MVVGVVAWAWAAPRLSLPALHPLELAMAIIGALLPDIDHPSSWIGRRLRLISLPLAATFGHRGITHSLLAVIACVVLLRWQGFSRAVIDPLAVGYLSHLAADLLTTSGLRLAWPSPRRQSIGLCRTGSATEAAIVAGVAVWAAMGVLHWHPALAP